MKKKLAGLLAAVMVLSMGMTAFAAESPATDKKYGVTSPTEGVTVATGSKEQIASATDRAKEMLGKNTEVLASIDVNYDKPIPAEGVLIRLNVAGVKKGDSIVLLHFMNGKWEKIVPVEVGNGYVVARFMNLSPVDVVKVNVVKTGENSNSDGTSPKTGDC